MSVCSCVEHVIFYLKFYLFLFRACVFYIKFPNTFPIIKGKYLKTIQSEIKTYDTLLFLKIIYYYVHEFPENRV